MRRARRRSRRARRSRGRPRWPSGPPGCSTPNVAAVAELTAELDAAGDAMLGYAADGRLLRANRRARERLATATGAVPATLAEF